MNTWQQTGLEIPPCTAVCIVFVPIILLVLFGRDEEVRNNLACFESDWGVGVGVVRILDQRPICLPDVLPASKAPGHSCRIFVNWFP